MKYSVIPAAGLATRFLPASKCIPKELFPVLDKPAIQYIVEESVEAGATNVVFVSGSGKEAILDHFDKINPKFSVGKLKDAVREKVETLDDMIEVISVRQKSPQGLGHAVMKGTFVVPHEESFAVMLPDMLIFSEGESTVMQEMSRLHEKYGCSVIALMEVSPETRGMYGIAEGTPLENGVVDIKRLVEKPADGETESNLAILGRYIFTPKISGILGNVKPGRGGEIQLTDAMVTLLSEERILGYVIDSKTRVFDTGNMEGFALANAYAALRRVPGFSAKIEDLVKNLS
ncbi:UTP--glucose-1-phosphate uridylyltransferase [bacterium]|nr:UTP--glucose-1-phosphate uridylyltransferase [bacterium]